MGSSMFILRSSESCYPSELNCGTVHGGKSLHFSASCLKLHYQCIQLEYIVLKCILKHTQV